MYLFIVKDIWWIKCRWWGFLYLYNPMNVISRNHTGIASCSLFDETRIPVPMLHIPKIMYWDIQRDEENESIVCEKYFESRLRILLFQFLINECRFYGYLPTRNGTRALTSRSGNVEPIQVESVRTNPTAIKTLDHVTIELLAFAYTSEYACNDNNYYYRLSANNMASDTAIPSNCDVKL